MSDALRSPTAQGAHGCGTGTEAMRTAPLTTGYSTAAAGSGEAPWKASERWTVGGSADGGQSPPPRTTRTVRSPRTASAVVASTRWIHADAEHGSSLMITGRMIPL